MPVTHHLLPSTSLATLLPACLSQQVRVDCPQGTLPVDWPAPCDLCDQLEKMNTDAFLRIGVKKTEKLTQLAVGIKVENRK
jgi:hypothetical protein